MQRLILLICDPNRTSAAFLLALLVGLLQGCVATAEQVPEPVVQAVPCEPEIIVQERDVLVNRLSAEAAKRIKLGAKDAASGNYAIARQKYEEILAQQQGLHADAFALWGLATLFLDRDNPDYSREDANTVYDALVSRVARVEASPSETTAPVEEIFLVLSSIKHLLAADISKDQVVAENRLLRKELSNREEAISRLRELTVGQ